MNQSTKQSSEISSSVSAKRSAPQLKSIVACVLVIMLLATSAYYFGWQTAKSYFSAPTATSAAKSEKTEKDQELVSPADNKKLEYNKRLTVGLYMGGISVDVFYEKSSNPLEGRIAIYRSGWNQITGRNEGAFIVDSGSSIDCLDKITPITGVGVMRFVTEYMCDHRQITITSFSFDQTEQDINNIEVQNLDKFDLIDSYFSSEYSKSGVNIIGWQDFNHLVVQQIYRGQTDPNIDEYEIYLFDVRDKSKQLIHAVEYESYSLNVLN